VTKGVNSSSFVFSAELAAAERTRGDEAAASATSSAATATATATVG